MAEGKIIERQNKDGSTSYQVIVPYKDNNTGEWRQLWRTTRGKRQAQTLRTKLLGEVSKDNYSKPSKMTVEKYLGEWLKGLPGMVSPRTVELYTYMCKIHLIPVLGNCPLSQLRAAQIQSLYGAKIDAGLSARTVQLIHVTLHKALKAAVKTGLMTVNPCDNVSQPKPQQKQMKIMQQQDIGRFLEEAKKGSYYALFHCYLFTGCRRSELLAITWDDVDLKKKTLSINRSMQFVGRKVSYKSPKTNSSRRLIDLSPESCRVLKEHRKYQIRIRKESDLPKVKGSDLVFCRFDNSSYLPDGITHSWMKLSKRCGVNVNLHSARHLHATTLLRAGVNIKMIQARLGHASINTTLNLYAHVTPGMGKSAALAFEDAVKGKNSQVNSLESH
jgi:integrase